MTLYVYKYVNASSVISTGFSNNTAGPIWLVSAWKNLAIDLTYSSALKSVYWNHICLCNSKCNLPNFQSSHWATENFLFFCYDSSEAFALLCLHEKITRLCTGISACFSGISTQIQILQTSQYYHTIRLKKYFYKC